MRMKMRCTQNQKIMYGNGCLERNIYINVQMMLNKCLSVTLKLLLFQIVFETDLDLTPRFQKY